MNKLTKIALAASLLVGGIASTQACSLGAWDSNGSAVAGGPGDATNTFARYQGLCSMQVTAVNGNVTNTGVTATSGPAGEPSMIARFYFLPGAGTGTIFTTYSDDLALTPVYTVTYSSGTVTVTPNDGGADTATASVNASKNWHSVEISWTQGGVINLWVDTDSAPIQLPLIPNPIPADPPSADPGTSGSAATLIQAAVLGGSNGMIFDAYESRRTTAIGRLLRADGDGNGLRELDDAVLILNEALAPATVIAAGTADADESGGIVTLDDAVLALNLYLGNSL